MNMNKIDINKQYRTKAGHDVQLFTTGAPEPYPVVGVRKDSLGDWSPESWAIDGVYDLEYKVVDLDLVEVKPTRLVYVNLHTPDEGNGGTYAVYETKDQAEGTYAECLVKAVPVYIEEEE